MRQQQPVTNKELFNQLKSSFYYQNKVNFVMSIFASLGEVAVNIFASIMIKKVVDVAAGDFANLKSSFIWLISLMLANLLVMLTSARFKSTFVQRALCNYRTRLSEAFLQQNIDVHQQHESSYYVSSLTNDVNSIETCYLRRIFVWIVHSLLFVAAILLMLNDSVLMTLVTIATMIPFVLVVALTSNRVVQAERKVSEANQGFVSFLTDMFSGFSLIKNFRAEQNIFSLYQEQNNNLTDKKRKRTLIELTIAAFSDFAGLGARFGVFVFGAYLIARGGTSITPGTLVFFLQLSQYLLFPIEKAPQLFAERRSAIALINKAAEHAVYQEVSSNKSELSAVHSIEVNDVSVGYSADEPILHNLDLKLEAGKSYAVVGASGSGKSTLLRLLMAELPAYQGELYYNQLEQRSVDKVSLFDHIGFIHQNVFVFNDTIANNITMFASFPQEQIERAIRAAGLSELVDEKGLDYKCGEGGKHLSGGERQRITIARSLLLEKDVLLFDEVTAALDNKASREINNTIIQMTDVLRVVVTHKLDQQLLSQYDQIIVMHHGKIVERGKFDELVAQKRYFYSLLLFND